MPVPDGEIVTDAGEYPARIAGPAWPVAVAIGLTVSVSPLTTYTVRPPGVIAIGVRGLADRDRAARGPAAVAIGVTVSEP